MCFLLYREDKCLVSGVGHEFSPEKARRDITSQNLNYDHKQRSGTLNSITGKQTHPKAVKLLKIHSQKKKMFPCTVKLFLISCFMNNNFIFSWQITGCSWTDNCILGRDVKIPNFVTYVKILLHWQKCT